MALVDLKPITDKLEITNRLLTDVLLQMQLILVELQQRPSCTHPPTDKVDVPRAISRIRTTAR
jgi:hypothetical protein